MPMANVATGDIIAAGDHNSIVAAIKGTTGENLTVFTKGVDIVSASALVLGADGNYWHVTGTVAITSISSLPAGTVIKLEFDGALLLTHNATTLILQGATSYTTAAGDIFEFTSEGSGNWRETGRGLSATTTTIASTFGATPSLTFSTTNTAGTGTGFVRRNAQIALFDTTVARALAFGDVGTVGSSGGFAAQVLHGHPMPGNAIVASVGNILAVASTNGNLTWGAPAASGTTVVITHTEKTTQFSTAAGFVTVTGLSQSVNTSATNNVEYRVMGLFQMSTTATIYVGISDSPNAATIIEEAESGTLGGDDIIVNVEWIATQATGAKTIEVDLKTSAGTAYANPTATSKMQLVTKEYR